MPRLFLVLEPHDSLPLDTFNSFCFKKLSSKKNPHRTKFDQYDVEPSRKIEKDDILNLHSPVIPE